MKIIGIIGEMASGKNTFAKMIEEVLPEGLYIQHLDYSILLDNILKPLNHSWEGQEKRQVKQELGGFLEEMLARHKHSFTAALYNGMNQGDMYFTVACGIRFPSQLREWRVLEPDFYALYIEADEKIRWDRYRKRQAEQDQPLISLEDFQQLHEAETEKHICSMINISNGLIINEGDEDSLRTKAKDFVRHWKQ